MKGMQKLTETLPFEVEQYFDSRLIYPEQWIRHNKNVRSYQIKKGFDLVREVLRQYETFLHDNFLNETDRKEADKLI
jgi:hypothetical protein